MSCGVQLYFRIEIKQFFLPETLRNKTKRRLRGRLRWGRGFMVCRLILITKNLLFPHADYRLRLLRIFAGILGEKIRMRAVLRENTASYISLGSLINVDFGKKYKLPVSLIPQKKIANNHGNDHVSFS